VENVTEANGFRSILAGRQGDSLPRAPGRPYPVLNEGGDISQTDQECPAERNGLSGFGAALCFTCTRIFGIDAESSIQAITFTAPTHSREALLPTLMTRVERQLYGHGSPSSAPVHCP
jgi:hypothetical protein